MPLSRLFLSALCAVVISSTLASQAPDWRATLDRTITADDADLSALGQVLLLPSGELAVEQDQDGLIRFIGKAPGLSSTTFGHKGEGPGEFRGIRWLGLQGSTFWVEDVQSKRLTFLTADHKLLRTVPEPVTLTMKGVATTWSAIFVQGITADGSLLITALRGMNQPRPEWATEAQWLGTPYLRVTLDGAIRNVVASAPPDPCYQSIQFPRGVTGFSIPFCAGPRPAIASDGSMIALAISDNVAHTYHIWAMGPAGDTLFSKRFTYKPIAVPNVRFDSAMDRARTNLARNNVKPPAFTRPDGYPALDRLLVGRDQTVWLGEYPTGATRHWKVLDKLGAVIGGVTLGKEVDVQVADRAQVWGVSRDKDGDEKIVHYTLGRVP